MDLSTDSLASAVASVAALVLLYAVVSFLIIVTNNCDVATALHPSLKKDGSDPVFEDGAVVWITGAGSGLGECLAYLLAQTEREVKLILSSRKKENLEKVAAKCRSLNDKIQVEVLTLDFSDLESIPGKVQEAKKLWNGGPNNQIDVVINGAGVTTRSYCNESSFELDYYVAKVNYLGPVCLIKNLFPKLPTTFIQLGSIASKLGAPVRTAYTGSKHALHGWMEALGVENVLQGRTNVYGLQCILGSIDTGLGSRALVDVKDGKVVTLQQDDSNLSTGLKPEKVAERILAVAKTRYCNECWIANNKELLPILYFTTYARQTASKVLSMTIGLKYAVTKRQQQKEKSM